MLRALIQPAPTSSLGGLLTTLVKSLRLLFPNGDEGCRAETTLFLQEICEMQNGALKSEMAKAFSEAPDLAESAPNLVALAN